MTGNWLGYTQNTSVAEVTATGGMSWSSAHVVFARLADAALARLPRLPDHGCSPQAVDDLDARR